MIRSFCTALIAFSVTVATGLAAADTAAPAAASAATPGSTAESDSAGLQEVVVTARRRAEDLQSVPLAVTAVTAETIQNQDITNIEDLGSFVPNMKISQDRATSSTINIYIRGVGQSDPLWGFEPGVGVYIDDVLYGPAAGGTAGCARCQSA